MIRFFFLVFVFLFSFSEGGKAQTLSAITPEAVARILQQAGYSYQSKFDALNRPRIVVSDPKEGLKAERFEIYFFDCEGEVNCQSITLWSIYVPKAEVSYARANLWNQKNRFVRSYLDKDLLAVLEMDIQGYGGLGIQNLTVLINAYLKVMPAYAKFMAADLEPDY